MLSEKELSEEIQKKVKKYTNEYKDLPRLLKDKMVQIDVLASTVCSKEIIPEGKRCPFCGTWNEPIPGFSQPRWCRFCKRSFRSGSFVTNIKPKKGVSIMNLYRVVMVYGEDRNKPIIKESLVVGENEEQAKIKSGFMPESTWDVDFLTINVQNVCDVAIKERPTEVKNV